MSVLVFHVNGDWLPGGYLGVDLFFVISGFVVTMSVYERPMPYHKFLARRFYRLAPAAAATIVATLLVFHFTGLGLLTAEHAISGLSAVFGVSNFYFMFNADYFDTALHGNPFLHFWSLSVEEQFYLVWPAILLLMVKRTTAAIIGVVAGFAALSAAIYAYAPQQAFYLMPARAYQFGAGSFAFFLAQRVHHSIHPALLYAVAACAIGLFIIQDGTQPWWLGSLVPTCLFAALVMAAALVSGDRLLLLAPVQTVARASYSIYLVHWPIVVYLYIVYPRAGWVYALALTASVVVGILLFRFVELPFNHYKATGWASVRTRAAAPSMFGLAGATAAALVIIGFDRAVDLPIAPAGQPQSLIHEAQAPLTDTLVLRKNVTAKTYACQTYEVGRLNGDLKYKLSADLDMAHCLKGRDLLIADSTNQVAAPFVSLYLKSDDIAQLNGAGCMFTVEPKGNDCGKLNEIRLRLLAKPVCDYEHVFVAANWHLYTQAALDNLLVALSKSSCRVFLLDALPHFIADPSQVVAAADGANPNLADRLHPAVLERQRFFRTLEIPNISVIHWSTAEGELPAKTPEGEKIYRDNYHYTNAGMSWLLQRHAEALLRHRP